MVENINFVSDPVAGDSVNPVRILFSAVDKYPAVSIVKPVEVDTHRGFVSCGDGNNYLEYLRLLYSKVTILKACVDTTVDYARGNGIEVPVGCVVSSDRLYELSGRLLRDLCIFGGFAINVIRNRVGSIVSLHWVPFESLRSNADGTMFYYSKDWGRSYGRVKTEAYPVFDLSSNAPSSIYYYNPNAGVTVYPIAPWAPAIECAEMQRRINEFHLNSLANGFAGSYLITFNSGVPNQEQANEIESNLLEKFSGTENAGRIAISFADDREHAAEIHKLDIDDFGVKYETLKSRSMEEIMLAFRLNAQLLGINQDNIGFNEQEFVSAFSLFNRTVVLPLQRTLLSVYRLLLGVDAKIVPFSLTV